MRTRLPRINNLNDGDIITVCTNVEPFALRLRCCDCGLVHDVRITQKAVLYEDEKLEGRIDMEFYRNNRSTGQVRKRSR